MRHIEWSYGIDPTGEGFFWPASNQKRAEWLTIKRLRPQEAAAVYQCDPRANNGFVFTAHDLSRRYAPPAGLQHGIRQPEVAAFCARGALIVQAWDTAFSAMTSSDYTVCVTGLLVPCQEYHAGEDPATIGECEQHYDVDILDVFRERIPWAGLPTAARTLYQRWQPSVVVIEKRAYGAPLIEALEHTNMPLDPVVPVEGKRSRAIEGVGAGSVQGWFRSWRVRLPAEAPWLLEYEREMLGFTGVKGGTDDQVDATVHLVGKAIREGGNGLRMPSGWGNPEEVDKAMREPEDSTIGAIFGLDNIFDPFDGTCGRCQHYAASASFCRFHSKRFAAIHGCDEFVAQGAERVAVLRR